MKSFGIWYKLKEEQSEEADFTEVQEDKSIEAQTEGISESCSVETEGEQVPQNNPGISVHVNLWSLKDVKTEEKINAPFLDVGLKISNFSQLQSITFHCPFVIKKEDEDIIDLSDKLSTKENATIIFNTDCEIATKDSYTIVNLSDEESLLIFPLKQSFPGIFKIEKLEDFPKTNIVFEFENFLKYISKVKKLKDVQNIYIRFRIKSDGLKDSLYFDSELLNKSFESAFSGTRVIDFKINEKRNIEEKIKADVLINGHTWAKLKKVHLLVMEPSSYDLTSFSEGNMTCRELEAQIWDDYLETKIDFSKSHVLVYHWKSKGKNKSDFSCLIKIKYSNTRKIKILSYMLMVVGLGILGSAIVNNIYAYFEGDKFWGYPLFISFLTAVGFMIIGYLSSNKNS